MTRKLFDATRLSLTHFGAASTFFGSNIESYLCSEVMSIQEVDCSSDNGQSAVNVERLTVALIEELLENLII